jgi:hypothetical protein
MSISKHEAAGLNRLVETCPDRRIDPRRKPFRLPTGGKL